MTSVFGFILCYLLISKISFPKAMAQKKVFSVLLSIDIQKTNCPEVNFSCLSKLLQLGLLALRILAFLLTEQ